MENTTLDPWTIIKNACVGTEPVNENTIIRHFLAAGYGPKRAKYWIREYVKSGLLLNSGPKLYRL